MEYFVERFSESNIAEDSGFENYWVVVLEGIGDCGSRADVMRWLSVSTPWSLHSRHPRHPLQPPPLIPSVFIRILDDQDKKPIFFLRHTAKGSTLSANQLGAAVAAPSSVQLLSFKPSNVWVKVGTDIERKNAMTKSNTIGRKQSGKDENKCAKQEGDNMRDGTTWRT